MRRFIIMLIQAYQWLVSPLLHTLIPVRSGCRFTPTCSELTMNAVRQEGVLRGIRKGMGQLSHCHPF